MKFPGEIAIPVLARYIRRGDANAVARAITLVEDHRKEAVGLLSTLDQKKIAESVFIGITGSPGVGKSTLTSRLAQYFREKKRTVGIVSVDPSSSVSGGAILGDRIRMMEHAGDARVLMRSMASRDSSGGLSAAAGAAARIMAAAGCAPVLIETVGAGQSEHDVALLADLTILLLAPGQGDDIQFLKSGISEIADIWVINKMDLAGAERMLAFARTEAKEKRKQVFGTVATKNEGMDSLARHIESLETERTQKDGIAEKRAQALRQETADRVLALLRPEVHKFILNSRSHADPYVLAEKIFKRFSRPSSRKIRR